MHGRRSRPLLVTFLQQVDQPPTQLLRTSVHQEGDARTALTSARKGNAGVKLALLPRGGMIVQILVQQGVDDMTPLMQAPQGDKDMPAPVLHRLLGKHKTTAQMPVLPEGNGMTAEMPVLLEGNSMQA